MNKNINLRFSKYSRTRRTCFIFCALLACGMLLLPPAAEAATYTVTSSSEGSATASGTLRWAVAQVNAGASGVANTIEINVSGSISLSSQLIIQPRGTLTINGNSCTITTPSTTVTGQSLIRFETTNGQISVYCVKFQNCRFADAGVIGVFGNGNTNSYAYIRNCIFTGNSSSGSVGALYIYNAQTFVDYCTFYNNSAINSGSVGGAIYLNSPSARAILRGSLFYGNTANTSGGHTVHRGPNATLANAVTAVYCVWDKSSYGYTFPSDAGTTNTGFYNKQVASLYLNTSTFMPDERSQYFTASMSSGGTDFDFYGKPRTLPSEAGAVVTVTNVTNSNASGTGSLRWACEQGGNIEVQAGLSTISLSSRIITNDWVVINGNGVCILRYGIKVNNSDIYSKSEFNRIMFDNCTQETNGGALDISGGRTTVTNCIFTTCRATNGGVIYGGSGINDLTVRGCTFYYCNGTGAGTANSVIYFTSGTLNLAGNVFYNPDATYTVRRQGGTVNSNGQNKWDKNSSGFDFVGAGDGQFLSRHFDTNTLAPFSANYNMSSVPSGFPTVDFYGRTRADYTSVAAGAVIPVYVTISTHPVSASYLQNATAAALSVTTSSFGGGTRTYQWYRNTANNNSDGTAISGATSSTYTPSTASDGLTYYYCRITTSVTPDSRYYAHSCTVYSNTAAIVVNPLPSYDVNIGTFANGTVTANQTSAPAGTTITLTVTPATDFELTSISVVKTGEPATTVTLSGTDNTRIFTMPAYDITVTATFEKTANQVAVETVKGLIEDMTGVMVAQATANTEAAVKTWLASQINALSGISETGITITAANISLSGFTEAIEGTAGTPAGTNGSFNFTVSLTKGSSNVTTESKTGTITATEYVAPPTYDVSIGTFANGSVTTDKTGYEADEAVLLTITPDAGYELHDIAAYKTGETATIVTLSGTGNTRTLTMPSYSVSIKATFEAITYNITVQNDGNGTATANPASAIIGTVITLTPTAKSGYQFKGWQIISGELTIAGNKFTMPASDVTIKVLFNLTTGIGELPLETPLKAWTHSDLLHVSGLTEGTALSIYSVSGALIYHAIAASKEATIALPAQGIYIVKSGNQTVKVVY